MSAGGANFYLRPHYAAFRSWCVEGALTLLCPGVFAALVLMVLAAFAFYVPLNCKILAVMLLAGPHNWIELRYFLSRLPTRFPRKIGLFFTASISGVVILSAMYVSLMIALYHSAIQWELARTIYSVWGCCVCLWAAGLVLAQSLLQQRAGQRSPISHQIMCRIGLALSLVVLAFCAAAQPIYFGILLVFAHPLLSLALLDRELLRSKPKSVTGYRLALTLVPITVLFFLWRFSHVQFAAEGAVAAHILAQTGFQSLPWCSSQFLLSTLVFFDLMHYAVWLLAIPSWSAGWSRFQSRSVPIIVRFPRVSWFLNVALGTGALLIVVLWFCFARDYVGTSQLYFVFAIGHVLAEVPLLIWSLR